MKKNLIIAVVITASVLFLGAGCYKSSNNSGNTTGSQTPASTNQVNISNFAFNPSSITVNSGTTVTWTNNDSTAHTITSNDNKFNSGQISSGNTYQFTFNDPGTYNYHCSIHTNMTGQVIVK